MIRKANTCLVIFLKGVILSELQDLFGESKQNLKITTSFLALKLATSMTKTSI